MQRQFLITAEAGMHARPVTILVNEAVKYESVITISVNNMSTNLKSIMGVMSLGVNQGSVITIEAVGSDEEAAISGVSNIIYQLRLGKEY